MFASYEDKGMSQPADYVGADYLAKETESNIYWIASPILGIGCVVRRLKKVLPARMNWQNIMRVLISGENI